MLIGHGYFREYLNRIGECNFPFCIYKHPFFSYCYWVESRQRLEAEVGVIVGLSVVMKMINSRENWNAVKQFAELVLRTKKADLDAVA